MPCSGFAQISTRRSARSAGPPFLKVEDIDCFAAASAPLVYRRAGRPGMRERPRPGPPANLPSAISNLQALAWYGTAPLRAVVMDARRNEVYAAVYDDCLHPVSPEVVIKLPDWLAALPQPVEIISLEEKAPRGLARAIAAIATAMYQRGEAQDPAALDANYVRRSDAELFWKE